MTVNPSRAARQRLDLTDRRFGLLVARVRLEKLPGTQGERWQCDCDCGLQTVVRVKDLSSGNTKSCGHLTNRARRVLDEPHRAGEPGLYPALQTAVWEILEAGGSLRAEGLRRQFDGRTSRSTLYRLIRKASLEWEDRHPGA
jgi:hypothetical protein